MKKTIKTTGLVPFLLLLLFLALVSAGIAQACAFPVRPPDLVGARFTHYYGPDAKAIFEPGFSWIFTATHLTITAGKQPISPDLSEHLAAGVANVRKIEARWKLVEHELIISEIKVNGNLTKAVFRLPLCSTAPGLLRIGERQYVFISKR